VRVGCACGDTVVSSTVLRASDPVVGKRCPLDGLLVRADRSLETLVLDLNGLSLRGSGVGTGLEVERGGSEGAAIIGGHAGRRGEIVGFGIGIRVRSPTAVRRIEALEVEGQRNEGILLRTAGAMVLDVTVARNGGDGIRVVGQGGRLLGIDANENRGAGLRIAAKDLIVEARAERNGRHGIVASGLRNDFSRSYAGNNRGFGILFGGNGSSAQGAQVEGNSLAGIAHRNGELRP
jgi:hypothetical protein